MGIWDVVKTAGAAVLSVACPAAIPLIAVANKFLPDDKQLDANTVTGDQLTAARESLPPDARVEIDRIAASIEIAKEENFTARYVAAAAADGQSTRPKIARDMSYTLCFVTVLFASGYFTGFIKSDTVTWEVFGILVGTPAAVLLAYFGVLRKEHAQRNGFEQKGLLGMAAGVLGKFNK